MNYEIKTVNINELKPNPNNTRQHTDLDIDNLVKSIQRFGFRNPIIANKEGIILAGNGRYLACKKMNITEVPVHYTDMSEKDAQAFAIMDNKSAELSTWNLEYLLPQLESLKLDDLLEFTGFKEFDLNKLSSILDFKETNLEEQGKLDIIKSNLKKVVCPNCEYEFEIKLDK